MKLLALNSLGCCNIKRDIRTFCKTKRLDYCPAPGSHCYEFSSLSLFYPKPFWYPDSFFAISPGLKMIRNSLCSKHGPTKAFPWLPPVQLYKGFASVPPSNSDVHTMVPGDQKADLDSIGLSVSLGDSAFLTGPNAVGL